MTKHSDRSTSSPILNPETATDLPSYTPTATPIEDSTTNPNSGTTPEAGHTYIISSLTTGHQLTLLSGDLVLTSPGNLGCSYWKCIEKNGWLGFQNCASNRFLGHDGKKPGGLRCLAERHQKWEWVQFRPHKNYKQGFTIFVEHWGGLVPVGQMEDEEKLCRILDRNSDSGMAWKFIEVS